MSRCSRRRSKEKRWIIKLVSEGKTWAISKTVDIEDDRCKVDTAGGQAEEAATVVDEKRLLTVFASQG